MSIYLLMAVVLFFKPQGLFPGARMKKSIFLIAVLFCFPACACRRPTNLFYVSFASRVLIYAIAATSLNLVLGYGGMMSFGHAAFVGTGAYVAASCSPKA